jgi:hypothetical protein
VSFFDRIRGLFSPLHREMQDRRRRSREELDSLLARGLVEKILMLPAEFGGPDASRNRRYLPPEPAARKRAIEADIRRRIEGGEVLYYRVTPEYDSDSFVPAQLRIEAAKEGGGNAFEEVLDVKSYRTWQQESG